MLVRPAPQDTLSLFRVPAGHWSAAVTAQQTNLVRSVVGNPSHLRKVPPRDVLTGRKAVEPLSTDELDRFATAWNHGPIGCIREMNRAIGFIEEPARVSRYLEAAFDLELLLDRRPRTSTTDLVGVPGYLTDGYTDLGIHTSPDRGLRRQKILVDKERLRPELVCAKRSAIEEPGRWDERDLEKLLRGMARSLRESVSYEEGSGAGRHPQTTVRLSESVAERNLSARHLAILLQLRLQEAGISSRLVKGKLHLYSLKLKHAWNVVQEADRFALVDAAFGEDEDPFVRLGGTPAEIYQTAAELKRVYCPSPDSFHHYEIRTA